LLELQASGGDFAAGNDQPLRGGREPTANNCVTSYLQEVRMNNHRGHRTAVAVFAIVLVVVILAALVTTLHGVDTTRVANNDTPPGVTGLSQPHAPLDRAPGRAVQN
jgi:hypothetical protein